MRSIKFSTIGAAFMLCLAGDRVYPQWEVDGPGAALRINGVAASAVDPMRHDIVVPLPATLTIEVFSGANAFAPVLLAASGIDPDGSSIRQIPGLGIINIGATALPLPMGIQLIGDGIGRSVNPVTDSLFVTDGGIAPRFRMLVAVGAASCAFHAALQSVVLDPTVPPFMLDMTECADVNLGATTATDVYSTVLIHGTAVSRSIALGGDYRFDFHGVSYSTIHVAKAGYITFGAPTTLGPAGTAIDSYAFAGAEPAIAAWMADWNPQRWGPTDGVFVRRTNNVLEIRWGDPLGMPSGAPGCAHTGDVDANRFGIRLVLTPLTSNLCLSFDPDFGAFDVSIDGIFAPTTIQPGDGIIGQTPGGAQAQIFGIDRDLHRPESAGSGTCMLEEHAGQSQTPSLLGWNALGTPRHYNDIRSFAQTTVSFRPLTAQIPGDGGYTSTADRPAPPDVQSIIPSSWSQSGGESVTIIGKFTGFNDLAGSGGIVEVVDSQSNVVLATVVGIRDSSGLSQPMLPNTPNYSPTRDGEAMVLTTPSMAGLTGPLTLRVSFLSGHVETLPLTTWSNVVTETFSPGDEGYVRYNLRTMPIRFYGTTYSELFISANGVCSFVRPESIANPTLADFTNTVGAVPNPSVAVLWTDLAPPPAGSGAQVVVTQNPSTGRTTISWNGFQYFQTITTCGTFSVEFAPGDLIQMNLSGVTAAPFFPGLPLFLTGVSDGGPGPDINLMTTNSTMFTTPGTSLYVEAFITSTNLLNGQFGTTPHLQEIGGNGTWAHY